MPCEKCKSHEADLELPCKHFICTVCSKKIIGDKGERTYALTCPNSKCGAPFSVAEEPHEGKTVFVKDQYKSEIKVLKDVIKPCSGKVMGMTILEGNLYVVCSDPKHVIFKYNISVSDQTNRKPAELSISQMKWPRGIAASESQGCLYITDWHKIFGGKLWRYNCLKEQLADDPVAVLDVQPFGVSVSRRNGEVLVTCATPVDVLHKRGWIYVYEPTGDGLKKPRVIDLPDLEIPRHSILTKSSLFIACHGWKTGIHGVTSFQDQPGSHVSVNSFYGQPKRYRGNRGDRFTLNRPLSMALDKDGLILVVDYYNHRIHLLTENLYFIRHLITADEHPVIYPRHVCVDASTGRIYVGQEDGKIIVFDGR